MLCTWGMINRFMNRRLLCWAACLALAGALMLPGTSFGAWTVDSFAPTITCNPDVDPPCIRAVVVQTDGKVLIGGAFIAITTGGTTTSSTSGGNIMVRLNANGTLDTTFRAVNVDDAVDSIAIQPTDQKIIIGGHFHTITSGATTTVNHIARLTTNGSLDTTFTPSADSTVFALAVQSDGKVLMGGDFRNVNGVLNPFFARLNSNGSLDTGFDLNLSSVVKSIVTLETTSQILVGGDFRKANCVYYPTDGPIDPLTGYPTYYQGDCILTDYSLGLTDVNYIVRANMSNGSLDTSFLSTIDPLNDQDSYIYVLSPLSGGPLLVGGGMGDFKVSGTSYVQNYLARLDSGGNLDATFNPAFTPSFVSSTEHNAVNAIAVQASGNIITGGTFTAINGLTRNNIARFTSAGALDPNFDPNANGPVNVVV